MILQEIAERTIKRVEYLKTVRKTEEVKREALALGRGEQADFYKALSSKQLSFICEVKKASPSKGVIAEDFPYLEIAREYEAAGAAAISVLTEPYYFLGKDDYLSQIAEAVKLPLLRKDFTVDAYQIYEARILKASAVLLICALMNRDKLKEYLDIVEELSMSALVEVHTEAEAEMALDAGAKIIGVNNRDLKTFHVDLATSQRLRKMIPEGILFVSESGIKTPEDIKTLEQIGTDAVLIGETFMRSTDKKGELARLRG